jgi:Protein of unknown function (DUF429)
VGIDVAFAKRKRLPVCICVWHNGRLIPLSTRQANLPEIPRGSGNRATIDPFIVTAFVSEVAKYLRALEGQFRLRIRRIAIDAPSAPKENHQERRQAEQALDCKGISCFTTPSVSSFEEIRGQVAEYLKNGGAEARMPRANQLWMLVGFELFKCLREEWECLEVYPQATMHALGAASVHKRKNGGVRGQLHALAQYTGWPDASDDLSSCRLREFVQAPFHDAVDAYACAWIAALAPQDRTPLGHPPHDVIWVPNGALAKFASPRQMP